MQKTEMVKADDILEAYTDLKYGDWVALERIGPNRLAIKALSTEVLPFFSGKKFQVDKGSTDQEIVLSSIDDAIWYDW